MAAPATPGLSLEDVIDAARRLRDQFRTTAAHHDRTGDFPFANFDALREAGILNLSVDRRYGGLGMGIETACRAVSTIAEGEPSTALVYAMHLIYHAMPAHSQRWNPAVHEEMCRDALNGVALVNVMRVEPELGTPSRGGLPVTIAERTADGWRLTGHKLYATGSPLLRYFITWAKTDEPDPRTGWFVVPRETPGVRIEETWDHMGMRATGSHDLHLDGVEVPFDHGVDVRPPGEWLPPDPVQMCWNNLLLAALYHGIAREAQRWLVGYLHERVPSNLGAPLASLPRMQSAMGEIEALLWANERLIYGLAAEADANGYSGRHTSETGMAKYTATNNAVRAVDIALSLIGNPALAKSNPLERHHRDVMCARIHIPQDDMVLLGAGRTALGM